MCFRTSSYTIISNQEKGQKERKKENVLISLKKVKKVILIQKQFFIKTSSSPSFNSSNSSNCLYKLLEQFGDVFPKSLAPLRSAPDKSNLLVFSSR